MAQSPASAPKARVSEPATKLLEALRAFRREEARVRAIPAFRVISDRVLSALASAQPRNERELLAVHGIKPALAKKYGPRLLAIVRQQSHQTKTELRRTT
jgi:DNA topoisomerase-3